MADLQKNVKSVSVEPTLVTIADKLSLRYARWAKAHHWSSSTPSGPSSSISER